MLINQILFQIQTAIADSIAKNFKLTADTISAKTPVNIAQDLQNFDWNRVIEQITSSFISFSLRLVAAIVVFYVGKFVISRIYKILAAILLRRDVDRSLSTFILSFVRITLLFLLVISAVGIMGVETSSFIAIFASAGVAVGMALSGTLQNFAGGVLLLLLKPYKIGDYIEFDNKAGFVKEIQIFHTIITTINNEQVIIPNGALSTGSIKNYSGEAYRRVEWNVSISYGDDVNKAKVVIMDILNADNRVLTEAIDDGIEQSVERHRQEEESIQSKAEDEKPTVSWFKRLLKKNKEVAKRAAEWREQQLNAALQKVPKRETTPQIFLKTLNTSSVDILIRAWVKQEDYWAVLYGVNEKIYVLFPQNGLHFPFPQIDVHVKDKVDILK